MKCQDGVDTDKLRGLLRLGVVETVAHLAYPALIRELNAQKPDLRTELTVGCRRCSAEAA